MRISQFVNTIESTDGGPARNSSELNAHLNEINANPVPLYVMKPGPRRSSRIVGHTSAGVASLPKLPPNGWARSVRQLHLAVRAARSSDAVILHGYYLWWTPIVALAAKLAGTAVLLTPHGSLTPHQRNFHRPKKLVWELAPGRLTRWAIHSFVTGSTQEADDLAELFPSVPRAYAGIGTSTPIATDAKEKHSPLRLISLGRLVRKKRVDLAIDAAVELRRRGRTALLSVYGDGPLSEDLQLHVLRSGASDIVEFCGHIEDEVQKRTILRRSDILIFPSDDENFGIVLIESMAQGTPAVVSKNVGAVNDFPEEGFIVIDDQSPSAIANSIEELSQRYLDNSRAALRTAATAGWPTVTDRWIQTIKDHQRNPSSGIDDSSQSTV